MAYSPLTTHNKPLTSFSIGSLVHTRGREWIVLPDSTDELLIIKPLGGSDDEITGILTSLEEVKPATFNLPDPTQLGDYQSCRLLRDALRLGFRNSAGPFRSFGRLAVDPRPYQLVPLMMALRLDPVRLLIADDVGIGKTIEACLIARELLDRGEITRMCVLCPPHLAEQWKTELSTKFHIDAEMVLGSTVRRLERNCRANESVFEVYPYTIVSIDYIKSDRHKDEFLRTAPGPGNHVLQARLVCTSDLNPANDLSEPILVAASPPDTQLFDTANLSQYQSKYPIDLYWKTSLCETLYLATGLPDEERAIWGICYSAEIVTPTIGIKPIKVWMGHTRLPDLSQGWIPASELLQVFDGQVSFLPGLGRIDLSFSQPFQYEAGNNLAIMVLRPLDTQYYTSMDDFFCDYTSIPRTLKVQSDTTIYNPEDPPQTQASIVKPVTFFLTREPVNSADETTIPSLNSLTVYPNPFNPSTTLAFSLNRSGAAKVLIYNLKGQLVRTLQDGPLRSGDHRLVWDGNDQKGNTMASGVYLCRMDLAGQSL